MCLHLTTLNIKFFSRKFRRKLVRSFRINSLKNILIRIQLKNNIETECENVFCDVDAKSLTSIANNKRYKIRFNFEMIRSKYITEFLNLLLFFRSLSFTIILFTFFYSEFSFSKFSFSEFSFSELSFSEFLFFKFLFFKFSLPEFSLFQMSFCALKIRQRFYCQTL